MYILYILLIHAYRSANWLALWFVKTWAQVSHSQWFPESRSYHGNLHSSKLLLVHRICIVWSGQGSLFNWEENYGWMKNVEKFLVCRHLRSCGRSYKYTITYLTMLQLSWDLGDLWVLFIFWSIRGRIRIGFPASALRPCPTSDSASCRRVRDPPRRPRQWPRPLAPGPLPATGRTSCGRIL